MSYHYPFWESLWTKQSFASNLSCCSWPPRKAAHCNATPWPCGLAFLGGSRTLAPDCNGEDGETGETTELAKNFQKLGDSTTFGQHTSWIFDLKVGISATRNGGFADLTKKRFWHSLIIVILQAQIWILLVQVPTQNGDWNAWWSRPIGSNI